MFIVYDMDEMKKIVREVFDVAPGTPVLLDKFLEDAYELDVDCISDGETTVIGGMLQHVEFAGVHSGDAAMVMPPHTLSPKMLETVRTASYALAKELKVVGLMNVQYAIKDDELYIIEVNPRATYRALRLQGDRRAASQTRRPYHGRRKAERPRL